ncbi:hypothetical protein [Thermocrispum municipale]|jgi:hypothetical protein|uniref:hypothetical protein n=1 Tax=Thermocrispum municipale TaxID=37926 RepID=UPI00048DEA8D|nr:hypothetical protein [Thermocrispum municipale]
MPVVGFSRGGGRSTRSPSRIEEVFYPAVLNDPDVDVDELNELMRDPSVLEGDLADDAVEWPAQQPAEPEPEPTAMRVAKLAALVTAVALLCAAIVAAAFLDRQRRDAPQQGATQHVTGVRALAGIEHDGEVAAAPAPAAQRPGGAASAAGSAGTSPGASEPASSHRAMWTPDPCELAIIFYRRLADEPARALAMLGSRLSDDERRTLLTVWRELDRIQVRDLRQLADDLVQATVLMTTTDGEAYRVDHQLQVDPPAITDVVLLSSQRLATPRAGVQAGTGSVCGQ